jgi:hypothetical protein
MLDLIIVDAAERILNKILPGYKNTCILIREDAIWVCEGRPCMTWYHPTGYRVKFDRDYRYTKYTPQGEEDYIGSVLENEEPDDELSDWHFGCVDRIIYA